mmetsp:Transcript_8851/g.19141  ORF Transcript_8851/g.19141 Transcript_8851/m.19141 type:complete len:289 (+) Transcript_8851:3-869(+)
MTTALSRLFGLYIQRRGPQPGLKANAAEEAALRCWYMIVHVVMSAAGLLLCMPRDWLTGSGGEIFYRLPWPHGPADDAVLSFYLLQAAINLESCVYLGLNFLRAGVRGQLMMVLHHMITVSLIVLSWTTGVYEVGAVMMLLHDASDIGIDMLKLFGALAWDAALVPAFILTLLLWSSLRLVYFPVHIIWPGWVKLYRGCHPALLELAPYPQTLETCIVLTEFPTSTSMLLLLHLLLALHLAWTVQLVNKGWQKLRGGEKSSMAQFPDACAPGLVSLPDADKLNKTKRQ